MESVRLWLSFNFKLNKLLGTELPIPLPTHEMTQLCWEAPAYL